MIKRTEKIYFNVQARSQAKTTDEAINKSKSVVCCESIHNRNNHSEYNYTHVQITDSGQLQN